MKTQILLILSLTLGASIDCVSQTVIVNSGIPDNDDNGLVSTVNVSGAPTTIQDVTITLNISSASGLGNAAWNGDLYAYIAHDSGTASGFSVLLNRVGVTALNSSGYGDPGFAITFSDVAADDIHNYQTLSPTFDGTGRLTGSWQPDGRNIPPTSLGETFDSASRTAGLSSFSGLNPNGLWVLFVSDRATGNEATLDSWSLNVISVPEPGSCRLVIGGLLMMGISRRRRTSRA